jgi:hypothetical protein
MYYTPCMHRRLYRIGLSKSESPLSSSQHEPEWLYTVRHLPLPEWKSAPPQMAKESTLAWGPIA